MFTTGSKLFVGGTVISLVAAVVFGAAVGGDVGWTASIGLLSVAIVFAFLMGINFYVRDSNVRAADAEAVAAAAAAQPPVGRSMWPAIAAFGAALVVVGAETRPLVFKAGIVAILAAAVEWMVQGWSERASADPAYNASVRRRILHPIEFPVLAAVGLGTVVYSFSRIMLFLSESNGPYAFIIVGVVILFGGFLFASRPSLKRTVVAGICAIAFLGLVSTGGVMAIKGQRTIEKHPTTADAPALCTEGGHDEEIDHKASESVSAKSNLLKVVLQADGKLVAYPVGLDVAQQSVTIARSVPTNIMFVNKTSEPHRLTVNEGTFIDDPNLLDANGKPVKTSHKVCTTNVRKDGEAFITVVFPHLSIASIDDPYSLTVPGVEGQQIKVDVP